MRPRDVVQAWVEAFNRADVDTLSAFYHANAINHQVAESPVEGREAIRIAFQRGYWDKLSFLKLHGLPLPQNSN